MGTRGFVGFVVDGVEKIAYNHWDSYPEGLGVAVLEWLSGVKDWAAEVESARALRAVDPNTEPTDRDIDQLSRFMDRGVGGASDRPTWYQLLRRTQGKPEAMLAAGVIEDASDFPADSLFAEWGYVIDFDTWVFEVYEGFQRDKHDEGRFVGRRGRSGYYPVRLLMSYPLDALPTKEDFVAEFKSDEDD